MVESSNPLITLRVLGCGCSIQAPAGQLIALSLSFCPLHAAAPRLLEACLGGYGFMAAFFEETGLGRPPPGSTGGDLLAMFNAALAAARLPVEDMPVVPPLE